MLRRSIKWRGGKRIDTSAGCCADDATPAIDSRAFGGLVLGQVVDPKLDS